MSQHPSLLGSQKGRQHRSVLKRYEKLKLLLEKEKWDEKTGSVYKLPKIKSIKFKVKKEKAAAPETQAAPGAVTPGAKPQTQPKAGQRPLETPAKPAAGGQAQKDKKGKA